MGVKGEAPQNAWAYKAVLGLPWSYELFIQRAVSAGHPAKANHAVPQDLQLALDKHMEWNEQMLVNYRRPSVASGLCVQKNWKKQKEPMQLSDQRMSGLPPMESDCF